MTEISLAELLDDTETQLTAARDGLTSGSLVDLGNLLPRIDEICRRAVEARDIAAAERLKGLYELLDALEQGLRHRISESGTTQERPTADARRAAQLYRAAAPVPAKKQD